MLRIIVRDPGHAYIVTATPARDGMATSAAARRI
jgi:hypothetical protein